MRRVLFLVLGCSALSAVAQTDIQQFARGSLIIPEQASFQTGCGVVSSYGLIWRILQSNQKGGYNANHPVTVYWAINAGKTSPNRCVPSNLSMPPTPNTGVWSDPQWNDGCDVAIANTGEQPVVPVDYKKPQPASGVYADAVVPMLAPATMDPAAGYPVGTPAYAQTPASIPSYTAVTLSTTGFTNIQYLGGPFLFSAQDAANVLGFLQNSSDPAITQFTTPCTCGAFSAPPTFTCHYVQMHQATISFNAYVGKRLNVVPQKLAVVDSGAGVVSVLQNYLSNAGLNFPGAAGCPAGTTSGCTTNAGSPGVIYDRFDAITDLVSSATDTYGLINRKTAAGRLLYSVLWLPHWNSLTTTTAANYVSNGDGAPNQVANAVNNISRFTDQFNTGLMSECASIGSLEGSERCGPFNSDISGGPCQAGQNPPMLADQTQAAPAGSQAFTNGVVVSGLSPVAQGDGSISDDGIWDGKNCTDPNYNGQDACMVTPNAGDPFAQFGDFHFLAPYGFIRNFRPDFGTVPASGSKPGVKVLATSWQAYTKLNYPSASSPFSNNGWDFLDLAYKDNNPKKGTIVYLGGHDYSFSVPGQRIVLNTLMNLGSIPTGPERALAGPVAYVDPNGTDASGNRSLVFISTYEAISNYPPGVGTYAQVQGSQWAFPYVPGHLRAHPTSGLGALALGEKALTASTLWDANFVMPLPGIRNLFTYFGGRVQTPFSLTGGRTAPHGVLQMGWVPEAVAGTALNGNNAIVPNATCVDVLSFGKAGTTGSPFFGLKAGADGLCDLQEALEYTPLAAGVDYGATEAAANKTSLRTDLPAVQQMLQKVRGYCFATTGQQDGVGTPILTPSDIQCNNQDADNRAHLGGLVHSSAVIAQASPNIPDVNGKARPTVAYVGGFDGQLHALYVSGGAGYSGPVTGTGSSYATPLNPSPATAKFANDYAVQFAASTTPPAGTELWAFLPASQLPLLKTNNAKVDSSPIAEDIFADLSGTGRREWHTIVIASTGTGGGEVFALDVTNPLKPSLLWDIQGNLLKTAGYPPYPVNALANDDTGGVGGRGKVVEPYVPSGVVGALTNTGLYNYSDMGSSSGVVVGQFRDGLQPVNVVYVSTSSGNPALAKGLEVFAMDAATGQKLWQWEQPYQDSKKLQDNTTPPTPTVVSGANGASRVYAGDMEGIIWELDAIMGLSVTNYPCGKAQPCKLAALDATSPSFGPQPITTNIAIAKLPSSPMAGSALASYPSARVLIAGTSGADWVTQANGNGRLHLVLLDNNRTDISTTAGLNQALASGVLSEPTPFPITYAWNEHLYGTITISGQFAFFETAVGQVGDIMRLDGSATGSTRYLDLGGLVNAGDPSTAFSQVPYANFGGVVVIPSTTTSNAVNVVGAQSGFISNNLLTQSAALQNPALNADTSSNGVLYRFLSWMQGFLN